MNKAKLHNPAVQVQSAIQQNSPTPVLGFHTDADITCDLVDLSFNSEDEPHQIEEDDSETRFCVNQISETIKNLHKTSVIAKKNPSFGAMPSSIIGESSVSSEIIQNQSS